MTAPLTLPAALADAVREAAEAVALTPQAYIELRLADAVRRDTGPKEDAGELLRLWLIEGEAEFATKH